MKKMYVVLLILFSSAQLKADCSFESNTDYVFQFLAKSGTLYLGSSNWLDGLVKGGKAQTNYLATRDTALNEERGIKVFLHALANRFGAVPVDTVRAKFDIQSNGEHVEINSQITDVEVVDITQVETEQLIEASEAREKYRDQFTTCSRELNIQLNEFKNLANVEFKSDCKTVIPKKVFLKKILASR